MKNNNEIYQNKIFTGAEVKTLIKKGIVSPSFNTVIDENKYLLKRGKLSKRYGVHALQYNNKQLRRLRAELAWLERQHAWEYQAYQY